MWLMARHFFFNRTITDSLNILSCWPLIFAAYSQHLGWMEHIVTNVHCTLVVRTLAHFIQWLLYAKRRTKNWINRNFAHCTVLFYLVLQSKPFALRCFFFAVVRTFLLSNTMDLSNCCVAWMCMSLDLSIF